MKKFLRRDHGRYSKLGKGRKKKQKWHRPRGRDNKMRERRKGYPSVISVGHKKERSSKNKVDGKKVVTIYNARELEKSGKGNLIVVGKIGRKKKLDLAKKAKDLKISFKNLNIKKLFKKHDKKLKGDKK